MSIADEVPGQSVFKHSRAREWTPERVAQLSAQDIKQLRANAERLNESDLAALCDEVLKSARHAPAASVSKSSPRTKARQLISRGRAFEGRGVWLEDRSKSWGGVRKSDGAIVMALWADAITSSGGECNYLLWAPNVLGARPWTDKAAGRERLEHCKRAVQLGDAEGLLVYGQAIDGQLPEDKAHMVRGVDAETVIHFRVQLRGAEYWAVWGKRV